MSSLKENKACTIIDGMCYSSCCLLFFRVVGRDFNGTSEVVQMTSGERKCWNITILDDSISEGQQANYLGQAMEYFYIHLRPIRSSIGSSYVRVYITDNDQGMYSYSFHCDFKMSLNLS